MHNNIYSQNIFKAYKIILYACTLCKSSHNQLITALHYSSRNCSSYMGVYILWGIQSHFSHSLCSGNCYPPFYFLFVWIWFFYVLHMRSFSGSLYVSTLFDLMQFSSIWLMSVCMEGLIFRYTSTYIHITCL